MFIGSGITIGGGISIQPDSSGGSSPSYVTANLTVNLDATNSASYPGSGTTWTDLTGNGYNATLNTGVTYSSANNAMLFNGATTATATIVSSSLASSLTNNFSVEAWYQCNNNHPEIIANGSGSNGFVFGYFSTNPTNWKVTKYGVIDIYIGSIPQNTSWHQVVVTYSSTAGTKVYVDGSLSGSSVNTTNLAVGSSTFTIGKGESTSYMHNGNIGIFRLYRSVLSSTDVTQNFNANRSTYGI
jgi:Concanavalin A-like lectin/glucanases superfamily